MVRTRRASATDDVGTLHRAAVDYYLSLFDPATGGFRFAADRPATLTATGYCVLGLEFSGGLVELSPDHRCQIESFLARGLQSDGSFEDPLWAAHPPATERHDHSYFVEETTTFCQQALDALLAPAPPMREWPETWIRGDGLAGHFESFAWDDAWRDSNRVMFTLAQLCHDAERHRRPELLDTVDAGLDWVDAHQSPQTGLWEGPHPVSLTNAMAATFHFTFFYGYRRRRLRYADRIIDSCLALQESHGLFSGADVGHTCLDYDALDLMAKASVTTDHRSREVADAMDRARRALERTPVRRSHHTGSALLCSESSGANALSTWFRLLALELTQPRPASRLAETARFRRLPFLGFHDVPGIRATEHAPRPVVHDVSERGPAISVVIPAFNEARRLPDALRALRRQTYPRWRAIVVNDGSDDDTGRVAEDWSAAESRIDVVHQDNRGLAATRNAALKRARGELVHCLDADDAIEPGFYDAIVTALRGHASSARVGRCAVSRVALAWEQHEIARLDPAPRAEEFQFRELARRNVRQPVCHVFERRILDETGMFDESLAHCQDWDLWLRFARVGVDFLPVEDALAWYRLRSDSLSSNWAGYLRDGHRVMERALAPDPRCRGPVQPPLTDPGPVHEGTARFWEQNLLRAVNRGDEEGVARLFEWGRGNLPDDFWEHPNRYGVHPAFTWAYDAPAAGARSGALMWNLGTSYLSLLEKHWPELPGVDARRVAHNLLFRVVDELEKEDVVRGASPFPKLGGIPVLARSVGWTSPRPIGLWLLLALPPGARRGLLGLVRNLGKLGARG